jgi:membrane peptidoglycan carboxypeptidase
LTARAELAGPLSSFREWSLRAELDLRALRKLGRLRASTPLSQPFAHTAVDRDGTSHALWVGPESATFVSLAALPPFVVRAITSSEDAGFFAHAGFDFHELWKSLQQEDGRRRGASTLTQQLAKNLFLSPERTYARKVREALTALGLESSLSKARLLEIYLNIAEWGPGLYGLEAAAQHYFGKHAAALSAKEAAFLATLLPNPVRYHEMFVRRELTAHWEERVGVLLGRLRDGGHLSDVELYHARATPLRFREVNAL